MQGMQYIHGKVGGYLLIGPHSVTIFTVWTFCNRTATPKNTVLPMQDDTASICLSAWTMRSLMTFRVAPWLPTRANTLLRSATCQFRPDRIVSIFPYKIPFARCISSRNGFRVISTIAAVVYARVVYKGVTKSFSSLLVKLMHTYMTWWSIVENLNIGRVTLPSSTPHPHPPPPLIEEIFCQAVQMFRWGRIDNFH